MRYVKYVVLVVLAFCADGILTKARGKSNRVLVKYDGTEADVIAFGTSLGLRFKRKVLSRYEFTLPSSGNVEFHLKDLKKSYPKLISIENEYYLERYKKTVTVNDAQWTNQWHLRTSQSPSMNVYNAWDKGFTGNGIIIAIVDDGIDIDHSDLVDNYNAALSYDVIYDSPDPSHVDAGDGHGSNCAGVAGAVKNTNCVIGVAFEASIPAIRILDENYGATASDEAIALTHQLSSIDIYSNSWGPSDDGESFSGMSSVQVEALQKGVTEGRGGKGVIYTWASGNGGDYADDCNADGYTSSIYTIAIAAMSETTAPTWYSEHCTAILAATYSGDDPNAKISTTGPADTCVNDFSGTSSACPVASGICALTLQANSALTWRDMQHMIVEYSTTSGLHANASFYTNAAGKTVSHWFGFGLMDAEAMVDNAPSWQTVPSSTSCSSPVINLDSTSTSVSITNTYNATDCYISNLEHVIVTISYKASCRGDVEFLLLSPSGTQTKIFRSRIYDSSTDTTTWDFTSVHTWGEDPEGQWTLTMSDAFGGTSMYLYYWNIAFYGTITDPLAGTPSAGAFGGSCTSSADCSALVDGGCLADGKLCVVCNSGYRIISDFCMQDGRQGGYCDTILPCFSSALECVNSICGGSGSDEESSKIGLIVGVVIGCIVGLILIICFIYFVYKFFFVAQATATVAPVPTGYPTAYPTSQPLAYTISETPSLRQPPPYSSSQPVPGPPAYSYPAV